MKNKTVVIIGSSRGIGLALATRYSKNHQVFALCRQQSHQLRELPLCVIEKTEVSDFSSLKKTVALLIEDHKLKQVDYLIHNAGIMTRESWDSLDNDAFSRIENQFAVNALGPLKTICAFSPLLKEGSRIGVITSRMGSIGDNTSGGSYGYRMSKAALNMAAASLAHDLKEIPMAIIHPGWVRTSMTEMSGHISPEESACYIQERMEEINLKNSGTFWHARGEILPW